MNSKPFTPLAPSVLKSRYGRFFEIRRRIDPKTVPPELRELIVYAEIWGVGDDYDREDLVDRAPGPALADLLAIFGDKSIYGACNQWLGHPEETDSSSDGYQGFSCLKLAYRSAKALRD